MACYVNSYEEAVEFVRSNAPAKPGIFAKVRITFGEKYMIDYEARVIPNNIQLITDLRPKLDEILSDRAMTEQTYKDPKTGLEWIAGPDYDITTYAKAINFVGGLSGNWRMPTIRELSTLFVKGNDVRQRNPAFRISGLWIWAEPRDPGSIWALSLQANEKGTSKDMVAEGCDFGVKILPKEHPIYNARVFAVRS
jgi:hypothetical protein